MSDTVLLDVAAQDLKGLLADQIASDQRLRGADSIYVAVAEEFATALFTWDSEML